MFQNGWSLSVYSSLTLVTHVAPLSRRVSLFFLLCFLVSLVLLSYLLSLPSLTSRVSLFPRLSCYYFSVSLFSVGFTSFSFYHTLVSLSFPPQLFSPLVCVLFLCTSFHRYYHSHDVQVSPHVFSSLLSLLREPGSWRRTVSVSAGEYPTGWFISEPLGLVSRGTNLTMFRHPLRTVCPMWTSQFEF